RHVRVVCGASGGMVGASYWVATLPGPEGHDLDREDDAFVEAVAQDSLTPVAQRLLFSDLARIFGPRPRRPDRGHALEGGGERHRGGGLDRPFRDLAKGEAAGWRPSLILSPMLVEDGRILLISNLYVPFLTENLGPSLSRRRGRPPTTPEETLDLRQTDA